MGLLLMIYVDGWRSLDPHRADFAAFYSGTVLWKQGRPAYDLKSGCEIQANAGVPLCMPFFHPPILLPVLSPVVNENYLASYWRWVIVGSLIVILCAATVYRLTNADLIKTVVTISFFPVFVGLRQGQDTAFVLLGILLCLLFLRDGKDSLVGIALSLTVLRPHLALALAFPLLLARPKAFRAFFVTSLALVAFSFLLVGAQGFRDIIINTLLSARGTDNSTHQEAMYNVVGIFVRAGLSPLWAWPFFVAAIVAVAVLWRKCGVTLSTFSIAVTLVLFTSPHLHTHDLALLIVPLLLWPTIAVPLFSLGILIGLSFQVAPLLVYLVMASLIFTGVRSMNRDLITA
jgi:hypothetical protein